MKVKTLLVAMMAVSALSGCQLTREVPPKHDDEMISLAVTSESKCADEAVTGECNPKVDFMAIEMESFKSNLIGMGVEIEDKDGVLLLTLDSELSFNVDSVELGYEAKPILRAVTAVMEEHKSLKVKITGHSDASGVEEYNLSLSEQRANEVSRFIGSHGVGYSRISVEGMGQDVPVCENITTEGKACNRRVELEFYK
ncbi:OmpA family protein [Vibrio splendidus]|nr:OmpA family protein [Vibrio splendidus]MCC4881460.1 OmpA family protein [Vibrio splendidus]